MLCGPTHVYLYSASGDGGKYRISIEKRSLSDFQRLWTGLVVGEDEYLGSGGGVLEVKAIGDDSTNITVSLEKPSTGRKAVVEAAMGRSP